MKKYLFFVVFLVVVYAAGAQSASGGNSPDVNVVARMDTAIRRLAGDIGAKLIEVRAEKVAVGRFVYYDSLPPMSDYIVNQLSGELAGIPNRSYTLLSDGAQGADFNVSGEIIEIADTVRVYARVLRSSDRVIMASFNLDIERSNSIAQMLVSTESSGVPRDSGEPDSYDRPAQLEIGAHENSPVQNRSLGSASDEDFFLIVPEAEGRLTVETTGSIDTIMSLIDGSSGGMLEENDDGASNYNSRISYTVQAGSRYIVKIRGYNGTTGTYGIRAYLHPIVRLTPDEFEDDNEFASAKTIIVGTPQQHTFHNRDDVDWVKIQIVQPGRYIIRARGVTSSRLDTYIELFDSNRNALNEDDDSGEYYDSLITHNFSSGTYYLKVYCLSSEPAEPYTISVTAE